MIRTVLVLIFAGTLLVASRVLLPVGKVEVVGNRQLLEGEVRAVTGLQVGVPWLWSWSYRLEGLKANPWVVSARLERPRVGELRIVLQERTSVASVGLKDSKVGISADGALLPGAAPKTPLLEAVPDGNYTDLLMLAEAFPDAVRIRQDAAGYQVWGPNLNVWSSNVRELQDWAKGRRIGRSEAVKPQPQPAAQGAKDAAPARPDATASVSRLSLYSWGVSANR